MENKKEILLNSKTHAKAIDSDLDFKMTLDSSQNLMRLGDRDIVLDIDQLYNKERNESVNYKIYGKLRMIFRNLYKGSASNYSYLEKLLYLHGDGSDGDFSGYMPYDEFAFLRKDVIRAQNIPLQDNIIQFIPNIQYTGSTSGHTPTILTPIVAPYHNWNLYLSYVYSQDNNYPMSYTLSGNTDVNFVSGDGIPFRVTTGETNATLTSPVEHGMNAGEFVTISGTTYRIDFVGNQTYRSEKYVINILNNQIPSGSTLNSSTIVLGKRCLDILNVTGSTSQYYVHKHKTITTPIDYIMDQSGFETPVFEDEKKILFENSVGDNDILVERNRMESLIFDFKEPFQLTGLTNNLGFTPTEVYVTTLLRNGNGYFNYPPKVGYSFNLHDTWIDNHFSGTTSVEKGMTGATSTFSGATTGFTFTGGTELPTGSTLIGAFVEYNPIELKERTISDAIHKFTNRVDIFNHNQTGSTIAINNTVNFSGASVNNPVGYLYQPHYKIKLRELSPYIETSNTNDIFNIPENAKYDENMKVWRWRDVYEHGYVDPDGNGTNFPFVNGNHYVRADINFYLRNELFYSNKQDGIKSFDSMSKEDDKNC